MLIRTACLAVHKRLSAYSPTYSARSSKFADWTYRNIELRLPADVVKTLDKIFHLFDELFLEDIGITLTAVAAFAAGIPIVQIAPVVFPIFAYLFIYKLSYMSYPYDYLIDLQDQYYRKTLPAVKQDDKVLEQLGPLLEGNHRPLLIAPSGAGKTSSIFSLVRFLESNRCPTALKGKKVYHLDLDKLKSNPNTMIDNLIAVLKVLSLKPNSIVFIDETHRLAELTHGFKISDALKPFLNPGKNNKSLIQMIGATTPPELEELRSKDEAFVRRCTILNVPPKDSQMCNDIIRENFPGIADAAISEAVLKSASYYPTLGLPARALKLLEIVRTFNPKQSITKTTITRTIDCGYVQPMPNLSSFKENVLTNLELITKLLQLKAIAE
jgi:hypothetical protein